MKQKTKPKQKKISLIRPDNLEGNYIVQDISGGTVRYLSAWSIEKVAAKVNELVKEVNKLKGLK